MNGWPIVLTENGMSCRDSVDLDGHVLDPARIDYAHRYLLRLRDTVESGTKIEGYFHWSLMNNFEWAHGYKQRFGLIHTDFKTLQRISKTSAACYRRVIKSNGESLRHPSVV